MESLHKEIIENLREANAGLSGIEESNRRIEAKLESGRSIDEPGHSSKGSQKEEEGAKESKLESRWKAGVRVVKDIRDGLLLMLADTFRSGYASGVHPVATTNAEPITDTLVPSVATRLLEGQKETHARLTGIESTVNRIEQKVDILNHDNPQLT
ncbi:hypothetical protein KEM56_005877 [Ascosphaera pollenicola]|nr:hypothetical protein KEM56_005877 [Ascosphaera pollenicola]